MTTQLTAESWEPPTGAARAGAGREGVRAMVPIVVGLLPMALGVGATAAVSGLPPLVGWASSAVLYGPSGQLTLFEVMGGGGSVLVTLVACLAVNAQMAVYGFGMRPYWTDAPRWWRGLAAQLLTSPVFALALLGACSAALCLASVSGSRSWPRLTWGARPSPRKTSATPESTSQVPRVGWVST